jgi:hypothetical protein
VHAAQLAQPSGFPCLHLYLQAASCGFDSSPNSTEEESCTDHLVIPSSVMDVGRAPAGKGSWWVMTAVFVAQLVPMYSQMAWISAAQPAASCGVGSATGIMEMMFEHQSMHRAAMAAAAVAAVALNAVTCYLRPVQLM